MKDPVFVLAVLSLTIWISEKFSRKGIGRSLGTALMVILFCALFANLGIIPSASDSIPLYDGIFQYLAPISIFFLLLGVNLKEIKKAGGPMLILFLLGSASTVIGILLSAWILNIESGFGKSYDIMAGMFTGTYTGGSINFNAIAIQYNFQENGLLFAGAVAIDNVVTTFWMLITLLIPRWVKRAKNTTLKKKNRQGVKLSTSSLSLYSLIILLSMGFVCLWLSWQIESFTADMGFRFPSILVLTTLALILAQFNFIRKMNGAEILGLYSVYLFLAVIGAYCDIAAVSELAELGVALLLFTFCSVIVHGLIIYSVGQWLFGDWEMTSIASQANVGGGTTALALAETFGRHELLLPAILIGSLGNALGTYLGFLVIAIL